MYIYNIKQILNKMERVPIVFDVLFVIALVCLFLSSLLKWTLENFELKDSSRRTIKILQLIFLVTFWVLLIGTIISFNIMFK